MERIISAMLLLLKLRITEIFNIIEQNVSCNGSDEGPQTRSENNAKMIIKTEPLTASEEYLAWSKGPTTHPHPHPPSSLPPQPSPPPTRNALNIFYNHRLFYRAGVIYVILRLAKSLGEA